jgi:hypothetical protein
MGDHDDGKGNPDAPRWSPGYWNAAAHTAHQRVRCPRPPVTGSSRSTGTASASSWKPRSHLDPQRDAATSERGRHA